MVSGHAAQIAIGAFCAALACGPVAAQDYSGPNPPKPDVPYLLSAGALIQTEITQAKEQSTKKGSVYVIPGAASPVKTPMAEPIFIFESGKIPAGTLQLFKLAVNEGNREVFGGKKNKNGDRPLRLAVTQLSEHLYRVEAYDTLEPGEYSLSPSSSNEAFCFAVY